MTSGLPYILYVYYARRMIADHLECCAYVFHTCVHYMAIPWDIQLQVVLIRTTLVATPGGPQLLQ